MTMPAQPLPAGDRPATEAIADHHRRLTEALAELDTAPHPDSPGGPDIVRRTVNALTAARHLATALQPTP